METVQPTKEATTKPQTAGVETGDPFNLSTVIEKEWSGLPGRVLRFPVCIAISSDLQAEREKAISLTTEERAAKLIDFRISLLCDILEGEPEGFPDFPKGTLDDLTARVKTYFNRKDRRGRRVFGLLIEEVVSSYWQWALPRPISSDSESSQNKTDTSTNG